jgi:hypothetical protein
MCQSTATWDAASNHPAPFATHPHPEKMAMNPTGITAHISGTTMVLADTPENPKR